MFIDGCLLDRLEILFLQPRGPVSILNVLVFQIRDPFLELGDGLGHLFALSGLLFEEPEVVKKR